MNLPSFKRADIKNKTALLRADFDLPLKKSSDGKNFDVADDFRLQRALPTIRHLLANNCRILIIAHLNRPKAWDKEKSLRPVALRLSEALKSKYIELNKNTERLPSYQMPHVFFYSGDFHEANCPKLISAMNPKDIMVLENLKFYPGENGASEQFAKELAGLAEIFVSDAFASSYDKRASLALVPKYLPHYPGLELEKEISALSGIVRAPRRPYVAMVGGIKLSDKLLGLSGILERADSAVVGGGLASLFFLSHGYNVGKSVIDEKSKAGASELLRNFRDKIHLPTDVVVAHSPGQPESLRVTTPDKISSSEMILDIGPETIKKFSQILRGAKTIIWSGPLGLFEVPQFSHGTKSLGMLVSILAGSSAYAVAGGGNTLEAVKILKVGEYFSFLSTGGSAMLQYLSGAELPAIRALESEF